MKIRRPDTARVLDGLKDFQLRTVEHVYQRFYLDPDPTGRFLVADEVGLGKTLIARGVTALALDHIWEETERIDVIYICSNAEIARQNLKRLRVSDDVEYSRPTRLTLLPREIHGLRGRKLNFISLTPGTSFDPHSTMGIGDERAVLYLMLREAWELGHRSKPPLNLLCANMSRGGFEWHIGEMNSGAGLDEKLTAQFLDALQTEESDARAAGRQSLRARFVDLLEPFHRRQRTGVDWEDQDRQRTLISDLRKLLGQSCIDALEPDIVILDEFQRFKHLLNQETEAGELAKQLFDYRDRETGQPARTLLLSATPYRAYATWGDPEGASNYEDFIATVDFLLGDRTKTDELRTLLAKFRSRLLRWSGEEAGEISEVKLGIERILRNVIARTERLAASVDRNGMLRDAIPDGLQLRRDEIRAYPPLQRVARALKHHDTLEYWKSAPYLLNLMDGYKLKTDLLDSLDGLLDDETQFEIESALRMPATQLISWKDVRAYRELDPGNARMRSLAADLIESDAWRLLWLPPTLPYYEPAGPYAKFNGQLLTKRLVFSSWAIVPKAIALALSYEAERRMTLAGDPEALNATVDRKNRGGRLTFASSETGLRGMPVLALLYPSFALAELVEPAALAAEYADGLPSRDAAFQAVIQRLRGPLQRLTAGAPRSGRVDERWYWAAPLLLDASLDPGRTLSWLQARAVADLPSMDRSVEGDPRWKDHLAEASSAATGELKLGRPPDDLAEVLAMLALAGPGVTTLRALGRELGEEHPYRGASLRLAAVRVSWALRSLFNLPEVSSLVRGSYERDPFWRRVLRYCVDGCLAAVLDEYVHVLHEYEGHVTGEASVETASALADRMREAIGIRTTRASVDLFNRRRPGPPRSETMRARFALRFGDQQSDEGAVLARADAVRNAFNSPFWPFVLASTSVGQEGLDFHLYCHAIVHWNLPSNPVDLEQREGRVHRYKGHAVRKNLAAAHGASVLAEAAADPWKELFVRGDQDRPVGQSELWPYWVYTNANGAEPATIERYVLALPLSRDRQRLEDLRKSLTLYRSVLGQARQEDLVRLLSERLPRDEWERCVDLIRVDLSPPKRAPLELPPAPADEGEPPREQKYETAIGTEEWEGPEHGGSPMPGVHESWPAYAEMPLDQVREAYETGSQKFRAFLEELATNPDEPRTYGEIEERLGFKTGTIASLFGGYTNRSKGRWNRRRPFHFAYEQQGANWAWMDIERAKAIAASRADSTTP